MTLLERLRTIITFMARRDNPNGVTAAQTGAYTKVELDERLKQKIPVGILPIYAFGTSNDTPISYSTAGNNLTFTNTEPVLIYGTPFTLAPGSVSAAAFPNTTSYVVVELTGGVPRYNIYAVKPKDTNTRINIGEVVTSGTAITSATIKKVRGIVASDMG